ncbi:MULTISPECIES: hypothetical protein [Sphingobium]|uniref:EthD domain-containing protein n=1 Tax=Sphingobium fuliginis ATCC 27551 TaxID=1208342 RepID=A0A5B8CF80_SPHSA|nr:MULTISPECIES: hypothetical protein [Sphingobium]OAP32231.1 hypothetical protein A8O16_08615 [Sphingobium sp. 20006FA]AJR25359.1 hypothetical protein TZ53_18145 [Sphingobium sp. YBL2]KXU33019.1 hypothetical protein AXW74_03820 [Sphingobium sp. AM]KYC33980.1 hypothetical protein A0J57_00750 [Sphingobium sp. 22B]QDC36926.1 hypothetical protein FIL70_06515 [Sphingobium fuliginis ATCC 27551]
MIDAVLIVLTKAVPGREADMEDWYSNIHIRDALRFRGSVTAQRFRLAGEQPCPPEGFDWQYLALYDVFDPVRFSREHLDNALTSRMQVSDAIDDSLLYDFHYYPLLFQDNDPDVGHSGGVILEELNPPADGGDHFRRFYAESYFREAAVRPGVKSAAFLTFRTFGQMIPMTPDHRYVAIYRINDPAAALEAWRGADTLLATSGLLQPDGIRITQWDRATPRLTKDDVQHPTAVGLAEEERARAHMGDRVRTGGAEKLAMR